MDFFRGTKRIGSDTSSPYSTVLSDVTAGTYVFTAIAIDSGGSVAVSDPVVVRVDNSPTVTLTSPATNALFASGTDIRVTASASDSDEVVRKVEFFANGVPIGTRVLAPYRITWSNVPPGRHTLTARATDLVGLVTTSKPVSIDVGSAPTVSIASPASGATFAASATITVTAVASDSDGTITRVEFLDGGTLVGTATTSSGDSGYSATIGGAAVGNHTLTARAVDDQGFATISSPISVTISAAKAQMFYIHTDHLNTPRMVANQAGIAVWTWDQQEPFGSNVPNVDANGDSIAFDFPLRFPGQYADRETGLAYNYFRDYDSGVGRYVQFDPIGLRGGVNGLVYVNNIPLNFTDPQGLQLLEKLLKDLTGKGVGDLTSGKATAPARGSEIGKRICTNGGGGLIRDPDGSCRGDCLEKLDMSQGTGASGWLEDCVKACVDTLKQCKRPPSACL